MIKNVTLVVKESQYIMPSISEVPIDVQGGQRVSVHAPYDKLLEPRSLWMLALLKSDSRFALETRSLLQNLMNFFVEPFMIELHLCILMLTGPLKLQRQSFQK